MNSNIVIERDEFIYTVVEDMDSKCVTPRGRGLWGDGKSVGIEEEMDIGPHGYQICNILDTAPRVKRILGHGVAVEPLFPWVGTRDEATILYCAM